MSIPAEEWWRRQAAEAARLQQKLADYERELERCAEELERMANAQRDAGSPFFLTDESARLDGKAEGVRLALSKLREMAK